VHLAIDDATRLAYAEVLSDEKATTAIACRTLGIRHLRTRPRRPQTNGKAERFIRTMLGGWAYGAIYATSAERTAALDGWRHHYNHHRRHQALRRQTPITRLNNLLGTYT
jgi:transposase InsO family protein